MWPVPIKPDRPSFPRFVQPVGRGVHHTPGSERCATRCSRTVGRDVSKRAFPPFRPVFGVSHRRTPSAESRRRLASWLHVKTVVGRDAVRRACVFQKVTDFTRRANRDGKPTVELGVIPVHLRPRFTVQACRQLVRARTHMLTAACRARCSARFCVRSHVTVSCWSSWRGLPYL